MEHNRTEVISGDHPQFRCSCGFACGGARADAERHWETHLTDPMWNKLISPQAAPVKTDGVSMWSLVVKDMQGRDAFGRKKYGTPLQAHNGRDALADAYQEALDLCVYLRQAIYERDGA
jgi:hypothetical protein